jgi:hypothetical protein
MNIIYFETHEQIISRYEHIYFDIRKQLFSVTYTFLIHEIYLESLQIRSGTISESLNAFSLVCVPLV